VPVSIHIRLGPCIKQLRLLSAKIDSRAEHSQSAAMCTRHQPRDGSSTCAAALLKTSLKTLVM
jgi:hypothetical protein